jgi:hypothetical protein
MDDFNGIDENDFRDDPRFDDGPEPDDGPESGHVTASVVWVKGTKNRDGKDAVTLCVRDKSNGDEFVVRSVKLADEIGRLMPEDVIDLKFLVHRNPDGTCFRNVVSARKTGSICGPEPGPGDLVLSVDNPALALVSLIGERVRRKRTFWTRRDGTIVDVRDMDDDHLSNAIGMLEGMLNMVSAAEEAAGDREW